MGEGGAKMTWAGISGISGRNATFWGERSFGNFGKDLRGLRGKREAEEWVAREWVDVGGEFWVECDVLGISGIDLQAFAPQLAGTL